MGHPIPSPRPMFSLQYMQIKVQLVSPDKEMQIVKNRIQHYGLETEVKCLILQILQAI